MEQLLIWSPLVIVFGGIFYAVYKHSKWEDDWYDQFR